MKKSELIKIIKEELTRVILEKPNRASLDANSDAAFADFDNEMAGFGAQRSEQEAAKAAAEAAAAKKRAEAAKKAAEAKRAAFNKKRAEDDAKRGIVRGKCQGEEFTKECAIAYLKEAIPLDKLPSNRANMEKREDAMTRHNVLQKKSGTSRSTGEKMYKVNGILVKASEIK